MGRNYGLKDYEEKPSDFTLGFWTGAVASAIISGVIILAGLYLVGVFG